MREIVLALTTLPADFDARALAQALVEASVAACVTVFPAVQSVYKWEGALESSAEQQLLIKTTQDRVDALWTELKARHPYDVPEFVVLPVAGGNPAYLKWIEENVRLDRT